MHFLESASQPALVCAPLLDPHLLLLRDVVYRVAGIYHPDSRLRFLQERCERRLQHLGLRGLSEYHAYLFAGRFRNDEMAQLLNEITVGETCFFRNQPQLDAFMTVAVPRAQKNKLGLPIRHLRVWSAGCSTGEEPYTIAISLLELSATLLSGWTFEVTATDLNSRSIEKALLATYSEYSMRNVPALFRQKYFNRAENTWRVRDEVKRCVRFSQVNLLDDARMAFLKAFDIIFCANVLIYFDSSSKRRVIQHFYNNLLPNSYLFLGHSESLFGISDEFKLVHLPGAAAYLKPAKREHAQ